jgi:hypothetical protein
MTQKIALLLSGNLRTFFRNNNANKYLEIANSQDMDIFIYTDDNDFYYNDCQYFSENNREKQLGIENYRKLRFYKNNIRKHFKQIIKSRFVIIETI